MVTCDFISGSPSHEAKERLGNNTTGDESCVKSSGFKTLIFVEPAKQEALRLLSTFSCHSHDNNALLHLYSYHYKTKAAGSLTSYMNV